MGHQTRLREPRTKNDKHDLSRRIWERKERAIRGALSRGVDLQIVAPSKWLADCARSSSLFRDLEVSVIPYGLDTNVFRPLDAVGLRDGFGFTQHDCLLFFSAESLGSPRKGLNLLLGALRCLPLDTLRIKLLCAGSADSSAVFDGLPVTFLGSLHNDTLMAMAYNASDMFVIPSLQDNLPNTVMESMACGTPVLGFDVGGIPDMVRSGDTGLLVPVGDVQALGNALESLCENAALRSRMSTCCREVVMAEYTLERQARAYMDLYEGLVTEV